MATDATRFVDTYLNALQGGDLDAVEELYLADAVQEWPHSVERLVGRDNIMAVNRNYPRMPAMNVRNVHAQGDLVTPEIELDYNGEKYFGASIFELKDDKVAHQTDYFPQPFETPQWRAQWLEKV